MKYIIPMIVGALIGYATNWLAIRMLFRPHYEKKILGLKIPFTPGLIPKEKTRIAKNIGQTVGEYLLSPKAISETLLSEKTNKAIKIWIENNTEKLKKDERLVKELFEKSSENQIINIRGSIESSLSQGIIKEIQGEKTKKIILDFIKEKLYDDEIYEKINSNIKEILGKTIESKELQDFIEGKIKKEIKKISKDKRKLKEILPEKLEDEINKYLDENIENIGKHIREIMESPKVKIKIKQSITNMVDQNVSRLITSFVPPETISDKIYMAIENYINGKDSNEDILFFIKSFVSKIMESKVSELGPGILERVEYKELSIKFIAYIGSDESQNEILSLIDRSIKKIDRKEILESLSREIELILKSDKLENQIKIFIKNIIDDFINKPISSIVARLENNISDLYQISKVFLNDFIERQLPKLIKVFNISKIVEDEINKFDVEFTEKLILDIAHKELRAITWLGALLGAILGLLSPLLQLL